jgi:hypothetical protein
MSSLRVQDEGVRAEPDRAPSPGEGGGANGLPGREQGDDGGEQVVGEAGETIGAAPH